MSDIQAQISVLKQTADPAVADAILRLINDGEDHELNRINVLDFSAHNGLDEERVISGFLHASRLGLFDLTWNVLCPDPNTLPLWEYFKQIFWSSGVDLNKESFESLTDEVTLDGLELPAGEKAVLSLQLPPQFIIVFEPVTHSAQFIDVQGEPTKERQQLSLIYNKGHAPVGTMTMRPGPLRLSLDNQAGVRTLPTVFIAADALHRLIGKRKPFLTAKRMLSNQTFRDVFKADNLNIDQRLKITSLTFLFTDLKGSTALYERVGDLVAFDLVRAHFQARQGRSGGQDRHP